MRFDFRGLKVKGEGAAKQSAEKVKNCSAMEWHSR